MEKQNSCLLTILSLSLSFLVYGSNRNHVYATKISTRLYVPKTCENVSCTHVHHNTGYLFYIFMGYKIIETDLDYIPIDGKFK